jgi:polyvinyl alcohol dehydrogenase (cytochrome)
MTALAAAAARLLVVLACCVVMLPAAAAEVACAPVPSTGGDWPTYGADLSNTRHQPAETVIGPEQAAALRPSWTFSSKAVGGAGDFTGTPIVSGACVFVGSNQGWVFAIDADTGDLVWKAEVPDGGTVNSTLAVSGGSVFAYVSREGAPYVAAFDRRTGAIRWATTVDEQDGSDAFASPVLFEDLLIVGVSGDAAQHAEEELRVGFQGSTVLLDAELGEILHKTYTIPDADQEAGYDGATVSTPAAVDPVAKVAYVGTSSPYRPQQEHARTNALLKVDLDRTSVSFGEILATYKGDTFDAVVPRYSELPCADLPIPPPPAIVPTGRGVGACGDVDVDFAAAPNLVRGEDGRLLVAASQKSGTFHAVDADTMEGVWTTTFGVAQPFGGVAAAYDGRSLYGAAAPPGHAFSLDAATGERGWVAPIIDGAHYGHPMSSANGVVYTVDVKGFLDAYDAESGAVLLHYPMSLATLPSGQPALTFGGVSIARNTVFAAVGIQNTGLDPTGDLDGFIVAFRPMLP